MAWATGRVTRSSHGPHCDRSVGQKPFVQLRNEVIAVVKEAGPSTHGKCAAWGWMATVAALNSGTASRTTAGVTTGSRSPAYSSTGAVSFVNAALVTDGSMAAPAKKLSRAG